MIAQGRPYRKKFYKTTGENGMHQYGMKMCRNFKTVDSKSSVFSSVDLVVLIAQ